MLRKGICAFRFSISFLIFLFLLSTDVHSQWGWQNRVRIRKDGIAMGGVGMSFIDGESFFVFNLRTEVAVGQFGIGLDVPLRFNTQSGELRDQDWNTTYDYFRVIRYLRYGQKRRTPVYARIGTLDGARLGHGFIMNYYTNEAQYDDRKIGSEFDLKFDGWGVETVVSNYDQVEIMGGRVYVKPLKRVKSVGILKGLSFGATLVGDADPDGTGATNDDVTIAGLDVELPLLRAGPFFSSIYADYAKIFNYGAGQAVGLQIGIWKLGGLLTLQAKLERRFLGKQFLPSYFDPFYEVQRFQMTAAGPSRKTDFLLQRTSREQGIYGELFGDIFKTVKLLGTFERIDGQPNSGRLHLAALLSPAVGPFRARALYDKFAINDFTDTFTLNNRSILRAGIGYQINAYLYLFTDYIWTFAVDPNTGLLETQRRIEPQLSFVLPLNFGVR